MGDPRRINLSLPADYIARPAGKVRDWLRANTLQLRSLREEEIVARIRATLGPQITALNGGDLSALVKEWAKANAIQLPGASLPGPAPSEPEIVARMKKIFAAIPTSIEIKRGKGMMKVAVTGATAKLQTGPLQHSVKRSWGGDLEFETQAKGVAFTAEMSEKDWRLTLAFGELAPNLSEMESVFKKGEAALRGALGQIDKVNWKNPSQAKQIFSPYLDPIKSAVEAASKSASVRPGEMSVSLWAKGDRTSRAVSGGVQLTIVF